MLFRSHDGEAACLRGGGGHGVAQSVPGGEGVAQGEGGVAGGDLNGGGAGEDQLGQLCLQGERDVGRRAQSAQAGVE